MQEIENIIRNAIISNPWHDVDSLDENRQLYDVIDSMKKKGYRPITAEEYMECLENKSALNLWRAIDEPNVKKSTYFDRYKKFKKERKGKMENEDDEILEELDMSFLNDSDSDSFETISSSIIDYSCSYKGSATSPASKTLNSISNITDNYISTSESACETEEWASINSSREYK
jgi:uncharacterized protein (UPF0297 family)